jgi:hypothetical protein
LEQVLRMIFAKFWRYAGAEEVGKFAS